MIDLSLPPGLQALGQITAVDPRLCNGKEILDGITALDRVLSWATGLQHLWLAQAATPGAVVNKEAAAAMAEIRDDIIVDDLADTDPEAVDEAIQRNTIHLAAQEIAPLLALAHVTARGRLAQAHDIVTNLPMIHQALLQGRLNPYRAALIASGTDTMTPPLRQIAAQILLNQGATLGNTRLTKLINRVVASLDAVAYDQISRDARDDRDFRLIHDDHGMARIWVSLPADQAVLIHGIIDELAEHHHKVQQLDPGLDPGNPLWRSKAQLRVDSFADIITTLATTGTIDLRPYLTPAATATTTDPSGSVPAPEAGPEAATPLPVAPAHTALQIEEAGEHESDLSIDAEDTTYPDDASGGAPRLDSVPIAGTALSETGTFDAQAPFSPLIKPTGLNLTMSIETLLNIRRDPTHLDGFGMIPDHLRNGILTSAAAITVMLLDNCGTLLDLGKTARFPTKTLARHLETRDKTCRFPGCNNNAQRADLDHQQPFKLPPGESSTADRNAAGSVNGNAGSVNGNAGSGGSSVTKCDTGCTNSHTAGETCPANMAALCRTHHLMKHHTEWQVRHHPDHIMTWTSPNGHQHVTVPYDWRLNLPTEWTSTAIAQLKTTRDNQQARADQAAADLADPPPF